MYKIMSNSSLKDLKEKSIEKKIKMLKFNIYLEKVIYISSILLIFFAILVFSFIKLFLVK